MFNNYTQTSLKPIKDKVMKSEYSVADFAGYGISIGSIVGAVAGVIFDNPATGLISGMILGLAIGFLIGRKLIMKTPVEPKKINTG